MFGKFFRLLIRKPHREDFFVSWHRKKKQEVIYSVDKSNNHKYVLRTAPYRTIGNCWDFHLGEVFEEKNSKTRKIAEVKRNYHDFWFEWVLNHPDGHDYLICGEDYQGVTVIRLDTGERYDSGPGKSPYGFCWYKVYSSPNKTMLAVCGCYWAAPYEIKIYDFSKPLEPFNAIDDDDLIGAEKFKGWNDDSSCNIYRCYEIRKSDGKPYYLLTEEEQDEVDSNWRELEDLKKEDIVWRKKSG